MGFFDRFKRSKPIAPVKKDEDTPICSETKDDNTDESENIEFHIDMEVTYGNPKHVDFPDPIPGDLASQPVSESEKQYYMDDNYYTSHLDSITLYADRIKNSYPSESGLYIPEIIMLHFRKKYPHPKDGYPGTWWFRFGIRNVGAMYQSLEERGYLEIGEKGKYVLTEKGQKEIDENEYVLYVYNKESYSDYSVWDINRMLHDNPSLDYAKLIEDRHIEMVLEAKKRREEYLADLKNRDPERYKIVKAQDDQIELVNIKRDEYLEKNNLEEYTLFWEDLWRNGGLLFNGSMWTFELADLYIKDNRFDDALEFVKWLKDNNKYPEKAESYITKIENKKAKQLKKRK